MEDFRIDVAQLTVTHADQPFFFSTSTMSTASEPPTPVAAGGSLAAEGAAASDELVQRARREIAEIVREVASLARQPIDQDVFFASLVDRTTCAIAAAGAVIWDCQAIPPVAIARTGQTTDASIPMRAIEAHHCLLREVVQTGTPVVVPSTPAAIDAHLPSNPTEFPAAVVPIIDLVQGCASPTSGSARFVLEVFLESEAGVATQRGYLRFVAQMADLASEFLRSHEVRAARRRHGMQSQTFDAVDRLHRLGSSAAVAAAIVDITAEWFAASRVSLAKLGHGRPTLLAVSHIDSIDRRAAASRQLVEEMTSISIPEGNRCWTDFARSAESEPARSIPQLQSDAPLFPLAVTRDEDDHLRLYLQNSSRRVLDPMAQSALEEWSRQALSILTARLQLESIPLAKVYLAVSPKFQSVSPSRVRRWVTTTAAMVALALIALIPTPMVVTMPATLRPAGTRVHYSPTDAIVERVDVKHGQMVQPGDVLVQLRDWLIEEQLTTLSARRGVLSQRLTRSIASLVEAPGSASFSQSQRAAVSDDDLVQQQRLLEEEIAGLDEQIELVEAAQSRLTIRAEQAGRVDAWQTELTATGRPVRRGEPLLRVEPLGAQWMADARITQSRVGAVLERFQQDPDTVVHVATAARPDRIHQAKYSRRGLVIGPASGSTTPTADPTSGALAVELALLPNRTDTTYALDSNTWTYGAPAFVTIQCAKRPLVQVILFDLERAARRAWARWL